MFLTSNPPISVQAMHLSIKSAIRVFLAHAAAASLKKGRSSCSVMNILWLRRTSLLIPLTLLAAGIAHAAKECQLYNPIGCQLKGECGNVTQCDDTYCYAMWTNVSGEPLELIYKGCWIQNDKCRPSCIGKRIVPEKASSRRDGYFCCCSENNCNRHLQVGPSLPATTPTPTTRIRPFSESKDPPVRPANHERMLQILLYYVVPILAFVMVLLFAFCLYSRHKGPFPTVGREDQLLETPPSPTLCCRPIQLVEVVAQGQFGTVWKANLLKDAVAVKIFAMQERAAWSNEHELYTHLNHTNILHFIAAEKHTDEEHYTEFWLVTEFHELGSLADYLKGHIISWAQLCKLAQTTATGLAYLHSEIQGEKYKPCIAHRDTKSKNVLVKADLSCCLADFGLAMRFEAGTNPGEMHGQVGTRRYMAPEVLEGAITFTRESFLRIDVYALALILWEMAGRCTAADGPIEEYKLPFEDQIGLYPGLEDMQQLVVQKKKRPALREEWFTHPGMGNLMETIEECWDQEADARLTAQCVAERMCQASNVMPTGLEQVVPLVTAVRNNTEMSTSSMESTI